MSEDSRRPSPISAEERERFLAALAAGWAATHAAELAGHPRSTFYLLRERDASVLLSLVL